MNDLENRIQRMVDAWRSEPSRRFPYEDIRRLQAAMSTHFPTDAPDSVITADLNEYFSLVAGLASGGLKHWLDDQSKRHRVRELLQKTFYERYPQYRFLEQVDLSSYPSLHADLVLTDRFRQILLDVISMAPDA